MATQIFTIQKNLDKETNNHPDGIVKDRESEVIGGVWNTQGPKRKYMKGKLNDRWIITQEEYDLLKTAKNKLGE